MGETMVAKRPSRSVVSMGGSVGRGEASGVTGSAGKTGRADAKLHRHVHHEPAKNRAEDGGIIPLGRFGSRTLLLGLAEAS